MQARRWLILATMVVSALAVSLDIMILTVALASIQQELRSSQSQLAWVVMTFTVVFAALLHTGGALGARYGRKRILLLGLLVLAAGSMLAAVAPSIGVLIAARAVMGAGAAAVLPSTLSIASAAFDAAERPKVIAIWAGFTGVAVVAGPIIGGLLLEHFWWGSLFVLNVALVVVAVPMIALLVTETRGPSAQRLDLRRVAFSLPAGFGWLKRRKSDDCRDVDPLWSPAFLAASTAVALAFFSLLGATFSLTLYLQYVRGDTPLEAGFALLPLAVALAFFTPRSARLARRFGPRCVCVGGLVLVSASLSGFAVVGAGTHLGWVELLLFGLGAGLAHVIAPASGATLATLSPSRVPSGSAVVTLVQQAGGAIGIAAFCSLMIGSYRGQVTPLLTDLSPAVQIDAAESLGSTRVALEQAPLPAALKEQVLTGAREAFLHAMHTTSLGAALLVLLGALAVVRWLPRRPA